jgi:hypothetical protein
MAFGGTNLDYYVVIARFQTPGGTAKQNLSAVQSIFLYGNAVFLEAQCTDAFDLAGELSKHQDCRQHLGLMPLHEGKRLGRCGKQP